MGNIITLIDARKEFEKDGYILLTDKYQNARLPLKYKCPHHPGLPLQMSLDNRKRGKMCPACRREEAALRLTTPIEQIRTMIEKFDAVLLDTEYKGKGKINFLCNVHPQKKNSISLAKIKTQKNICPYCAHRKVDFEDVYETFLQKKCLLLEDRYINDKTKMNFICLLHPETPLKISYDKFRSGQRSCPSCSNIKFATYDEVKETFELRGYELLDKKYRGSEYPLSYICPHHSYKVSVITYKKLKSDQGCRACAARKKGDRFKKTFSEVRKTFEVYGYILLSQEKDYLNNETLLRYSCPKHPDKQLWKTYKDISQDKGCPYCFNEEYTGQGGSAAYKGGVSTINSVLRVSIKEWTNYWLNFHNYRCVVTGETGELEVHHETSFHELRNEVFRELNILKKKVRYEFSEHEINKIVSKFKEKHSTIQGYPLKPRIHNLFHSMYGKKNVTKANFLEFLKGFGK